MPAMNQLVPLILTIVMYLLSGVLKVKPTLVKRRKGVATATDSAQPLNVTEPTVLNDTVDSISYRVSSNSTDTTAGTDREREESSESVALPSEEYDALLRDLNAREKVQR